MKKLLLILIVFFNLSAISQTDNSKFEFSLIDSTQGSKAELYTYAKSWLANTFVSSKSVIDMEDKEAGRIIGKGMFTKRVNSPFGNKVGMDVIYFTITIDVKDNKYRIKLSDFNHKYLQQARSDLTISDSGNFDKSRQGGDLSDDKPDCGGLIMTKKQWSKIKDYSEEESLSLLDSIKKAMQEGKNKSSF